MYKNKKHPNDENWQGGLVTGHSYSEGNLSLTSFSN